jgi:hypothetical protein
LRVSTILTSGSESDWSAGKKLGFDPTVNPGQPHTLDHANARVATSQTVQTARRIHRSLTDAW